MTDFTINDLQYRSGRLNAFQQFHVARKLGPVLAKLGPAFLAVTPTPGGPVAVEANNTNAWIEKLEPLVDALAAMSEEDCNYILMRCLSVVQRYQGSAWAQVWNEPAKRLMFDDIDMPVMIQIAIQVLGDNLSNFFSGPQSNSNQSPLPGFGTQGNSSTFPMEKIG